MEVQQNAKETGRVEAFSDGVFAIAITLLVLNFLEADLVHKSLDDGELLSELIHLWPTLLAFVTSFAAIGVMWLNHHRIFSHITRLDNNLILLNLLLLMIVTLVPFTTALVGPYLIYPDRHVAVIVYNGLYLLMALAFHALWHYARHRHRLLGEMIDQQSAQSITDQYRFGPLFYLLVFALSWIYPPASLGVNLLLAVFYALPFSRKHKSEKIPQHPDTTQISPENDQQEKNVPR